jgi:hypothetical protein
MEEAIKLIGGILGIVAFSWKIIDEFGSYLRIAVKAEKDNQGILTALATVENKGIRRKKITYALVLVGPESENPVKTAAMLATEASSGAQINYTNDIEHLKTDKPVFADEGRAIIPLPFFYSEQVAIGDEQLTYRCFIDTKNMQKGKPYSIRFFVFGKGRLHRSTQDMFVLN